MRKQALLATLTTCGVIGGSYSAQESSKVDFGRDVQPILRQHCYSCHGPTQQTAGFRLDRRRDAMRGSTVNPGIIRPGNSDVSLLYFRVSSGEFGPQMPPTGALGPEQIATIKAWLDQGAEWPDAFANETLPPAADPRATRAMEALRAGDMRALKSLAAADSEIGSLKGPGGSTPLMFAVLYADAQAVRLLLETGANPNVTNDVGATALMWAADSVEKTRVLLEHHADANAKSADGRTPLIIAAGRSGALAIVEQLLDHGANPSAQAPSLFGTTSPVVEAATAGDEAVIRLLVDRGADVKAAGFLPLLMALRSSCSTCADLLLAATPPPLLTQALLASAPPIGTASATVWLLDHGAAVNAQDPQGRTILMLAAASEALPVNAIAALIARGADVNAKSVTGQTALRYAKQHGNTAVVDLLLKAGANDTPAAPAPALNAAPAPSPRAAVARSLPLLQRTDAIFFKKSGCVSCHNNTLTAMTVAAARKNGVPVDEQTAHAQLTAIASFIDGWRERALQGIGIPGDPETISYILLGMAAESYPPDPATDAMARFIRSRQRADGHWDISFHRPPHESSDIEVTAASMRALQVYAPPHADQTAYRRSIQLAAAWLAKAAPRTNEDRAFQLLGLRWAGAGKAALVKAARALLAEQRGDGGWAQLPSLASDAYATGEALYALKESGTLPASDAAHMKGVQFLLRTQLEDGSWHVQTRAIPIQPLFDIGFPHGRDSWISAAGTNWATLALSLASPDRPHVR